MMNADPPFWPTIYGKRHMLAKPTAEPATAKTNPMRDPQDARAIKLNTYFKISENYTEILYHMQLF